MLCSCTFAEEKKHVFLNHTFQYYRESDSDLYIIITLLHGDIHSVVYILCLYNGVFCGIVFLLFDQFS